MAVESPRHPFTSRLTRKGQVTIPVHIRRLLGLSTKDRVAFLVTEGQVRIAPASSIVARTAGMLRNDAPALTSSEEKVQAEEAIAQETEKSQD